MKCWGKVGHFAHVSSYVRFRVWMSLCPLPRTNIAMILKRDLERGHVERLEPGMWVLADS